MSAIRRWGKEVHLGYQRPHLKTKNTGTSGILANTYNLTTWEAKATMIAKFEGQPRLCGLERTCWNINNTTKIISVNLLVHLTNCGKSRNINADRSALEYKAMLGW